jgi:hypothetical protein
MGGKQIAIGNWQLAKPNAKALTTKDAEKQQLAISKTNCKGFNHKGRRNAAIGKTNCKTFNHKGHRKTAIGK